MTRLLSIAFAIIFALVLSPASHAATPRDSSYSPTLTRLIVIGNQFLVRPIDDFNRHVAFTIHHPDVVGERMAQSIVQAGTPVVRFAIAHPRTTAFVSGCAAAFIAGDPLSCKTWGETAAGSTQVFIDNLIKLP